MCVGVFCQFLKFLSYERMIFFPLSQRVQKVSALTEKIRYLITLLWKWLSETSVMVNMKILDSQEMRKEHLQLSLVHFIFLSHLISNITFTLAGNYYS